MTNADKAIERLMERLFASESKDKLSIDKVRRALKAAYLAGKTDASNEAIELISQQLLS